MLVLLVLVFFIVCFLLLVFFGAMVVVWSGVDWPGVAGVVACAKVSGRVAAAKTIANKLFFILISPDGFSFPTTLSSATPAFYTIDSKG